MENKDKMSTRDEVSNTTATEPQIATDSSPHVAHNEEIQAFRDRLASDTRTLTSSIFDYQYENGRRYHAFKQGQYVVPNDEQQNLQTDIYHHVCTLLLRGELFRAPIGQNPERILDIGTGTGLWAVEFADQFPNAQVIGTDLSPIQPKWVPPNVSFEIDDCESEWTFPPDYFDFIHIRCLFCSIQDWSALMKQAYNALKPGGWIEVVELEVPASSDDGTFNKTTAWYNWQMLLIEASEKALRPMAVAANISQWLFEAGFEQVDDMITRSPVGGSWCADPAEKEIGRWHALNMMEGIEGFTLGLLHRFLGWSLIEIQALIGQVRTEVLEQKMHVYLNIHFVIGQKPLMPQNAAQSTSSSTTPNSGY